MVLWTTTFLLEKFESPALSTYILNVYSLRNENKDKDIDITENDLVLESSRLHNLPRSEELKKNLGAGQ